MIKPDGITTFVCDKCGGSGKLKPLGALTDSTSSVGFRVCGTCYGDGFLDWIDYLRGGKPQPHGFVLDFSRLGVDSVLSSGKNSPAMQQIIDKAAKELADKIDEDIINQLTNNTEVIDSIFGGG